MGLFRLLYINFLRYEHWIYEFLFLDHRDKLVGRSSLQRIPKNRVTETSRPFEELYKKKQQGENTNIPCGLWQLDTIRGCDTIGLKLKLPGICIES